MLVKTLAEIRKNWVIRMTNLLSKRTMTKRHNALTTVILVISNSGHASSYVEARTQPGTLPCRPTMTSGEMQVPSTCRPQPAPAAARTRTLPGSPAVPVP